MVLINVDLPDPFFPVMAIISFGKTVILIFDSIGVSLEYPMLKSTRENK
jgi:hypothetical protein